jgi:hypothetical protein
LTEKTLTLSGVQLAFASWRKDCRAMAGHGTIYDHFHENDEQI